MTLVVFFLSATGLSRFRESTKRERTSDVVAKGGRRDAWQVLANGGVFALAALGSLIAPSDVWSAIGAAAIASSTADTWATEVGTLSSRQPRSIVTMQTVLPGTSGGVTLLGLVAALAGAACISLITFLAGWPRAAVGAALVGGIAGSTIDSVLGATVQARRWCDHCDRATERAVHGCGTRTRITGGISWLDNDAVNAVSSLGGALIGLFFAL